MDKLKIKLGIVWMVLAPCILLFLLIEAISKINNALPITKSNVILQWSIILLIFTPICIGFYIFGKYCKSGEYNKLPTNSKEL